MQRLTAVEVDTATGKTKELFTAIHAKLGMVPNMMRTMGNSSALLNGYLSLNAALAEGKLGTRLGELIALTVANADSCDYCNAAHSFIAEKLVHINEADIAEARQGNAMDPRTKAALVFARKILKTKGQITDADFGEVKNAGYDQTEIAEIVGHVGLNLLTNYFNNAAKVAVDFPAVHLVEAAL